MNREKLETFLHYLIGLIACGLFFYYAGVDDTEDRIWLECRNFGKAVVNDRPHTCTPEAFQP